MRLLLLIGICWWLLLRRQFRNIKFSFWIGWFLIFFQRRLEWVFVIDIFGFSVDTRLRWFLSEFLFDFLTRREPTDRSCLCLLDFLFRFLVVLDLIQNRLSVNVGIWLILEVTAKSGESVVELLTDGWLQVFNIFFKVEGPMHSTYLTHQFFSLTSNILILIQHATDQWPCCLFQV